MIIGYERVSSTEQNIGLEHDDLKPTFGASVYPTTRVRAPARVFRDEELRRPLHAPLA
jgi:hypothetical protein